MPRSYILIIILYGKVNATAAAAAAGSRRNKCIQIVCNCKRQIRDAVVTTYIRYTCCCHKQEQPVLMFARERIHFYISRYATKTVFYERVVVVRVI